MKRYVFYDIETLANVFTVVFINEGGKVKTFEVSDRNNQFVEMRRFIETIRNRTWVGYNNFHFDWPIMQALIDLPFNTPAKRVISTAKNLCDKIIFSNDRFETTIWKPEIRQLDLMAINHFDRKGVSLKSLQYAMHLPDIVEFDVGFDKDLTHDEIDRLIDYNIHDVQSTKAFFEMADQQSAINLREKLGAKYGMDMMTFSDTKIGTKIFQYKMEERFGKDACYFYDGDRRVARQTPRTSINLGDVIFPYIEFERPEFQAVLDFMNDRTITETKGALTMLDSLGPLEPYAKIKRVKGKIVNVNTVVDGFQFDYGTGGIHGCKAGHFKADDDHVIIDSDVTSLYPSIAIQNNLHPEHLGKGFCDIYKEMLDDRLRYPKGSTENMALKLCLNSAYGNSNNQYSFLYDPQFTMAVTINGQLMLSMLAEKVMGIGELLQVNTDGLTIKLPVDKIDEYYAACEWWETITSLNLEHEEFELLKLRDVNNYIGKTVSGKIKTKGAYHTDRDWSQNNSMAVVRKAAKAHILNGTPIEEFIQGHDNLEDFMLRAKVNRTDKLLAGEEELQKVTRYYISNDGPELTKIMPPISRKITKVMELNWKRHGWEPSDSERKLVADCLKKKEKVVLPAIPEACRKELQPRFRTFHINNGYKVTVANQMPDGLQDVNYEFYIEEAKKLI